MEMPERKTDKHSPALWHVPVALDDVPVDTGRHVAISADADARAAIAAVAGLRALPRLDASFDVTRQGADGLHVVGRISATVGQNCVVTLDPLANEVEEDIDLVFAPPAPPVEHKPVDDDDSEKPAGTVRHNLDGSEPLIGGVVDLGALAIEFLILGLDPYPRKPGAVFEPPQQVKPDPSPFAVLAGLATKDRDGR
jgi:Large ribosomal RNA subunit accumulation protein YceD